MWGFVLLFGFQLLMIVLYPKLILPLVQQAHAAARGRTAQRGCWRWASARASGRRRSR
jgi:STE24 endopeptidase